MSLMFFADEAEVPLPPREVRIVEAVARPSPDGYRVALSLTLTPFLEYPNLEVVLYRPDGEEERSLSIVGNDGTQSAGDTARQAARPGRCLSRADRIWCTKVKCCKRRTSRSRCRKRSDKWRSTIRFANS